MPVPPLDHIGDSWKVDGSRRTLDQQRICVLEVDVHDTHHGDAHEHALHRRLPLRHVVLRDSGCHQLRLLAGHGRCGLHVLERRVVYTLVS